MNYLLFLNDSNLTGKGEEWTVWLVCLCIIPIAILIIMAITMTIIKTRQKQKGYKGIDTVDYSQRPIFLEAYGGEENFVSASLEMSRITVQVNDIDLVNGEALKELGAKNVLLVGQEVKASFGDLAENIYKILENKHE